MDYDKIKPIIYLIKIWYSDKRWQIIKISMSGWCFYLMFGSR
jgi:hypothetical protein